MDPITALIIFVQALSESEPIWEEGKDLVEDICSGAFVFESDFVTRDEFLLLVVARDYEEMLDWSCHRCDHIGEEEMAEPDFAKWRDQDVPKSLGKLDTSLQVEAVNRRDTHSQESEEKDYGEVLHVAVVELRGKFDHSDLPSETHEPDKTEDEGHSVQLVVDQFVVLVDLEDEGVVYIVAAEDLHSESS